MTRTEDSRHIVVGEHDPLDELDATEHDDLRRFTLANLDRDENSQGARPVLVERNGQLHARNHVGIVETRNGTVVEILPKVDFGDGVADEQKTREVFLTMLRCYRALRFAQFNQASIREISRYPMLPVFIRLFLEDLVRLTKRGLARHYQSVEDNLPCLRGRVQFAEHIRRNSANDARFFCEFDEFTADRPVNRLIHTTIQRLLAAAHPDHRQLLHQLRIGFADVPPSELPEVDWQRHRIDRSMRHYDTVMAWVGLFLFNHGLATYAGEYVNRALLFPMEEVFEDFLVAAFHSHQQEYGVEAQKPQRAFATICGKDAFTMKPDIALMRGGDVAFVLDAKWKRIEDPKGDIAQSDVYQLYSYGRKYGCPAVALLYPKTPQFNKPLRYEFDDAVDDQPLALWCFPFDVVDPGASVACIMAKLRADRG